LASQKATSHETLCVTLNNLAANMGLDIYIGVDNEESIFTDEYHDDENGFFEKHSLSREFCNLMNRQHVVEHLPELDQIGKITKVDISPLYQMEEYPNEEEIGFSIEYAETEEERQSIIENAEMDKKKLTGNIDKVLSTINNLLERLNNINNLQELLIKTDFDSLNNAVYFSDFKIDKGQGYIGNNFGQDLRNFKRFLEYAKEKGVETIWFGYR
jgi:hypothetical protein